MDKLKLKSAQIYTVDQIDNYLPTDQRYARYDHKGKLRIQSKNGFECWNLYYQPMIISTGHVVPCCFDKDADFIMGDLHDSSLYEIWHSSDYNGFRETVTDNRMVYSICRNCDQGLEISPYNMVKSVLSEGGSKIL